MNVFFINWKKIYNFTAFIFKHVFLFWLLPDCALSLKGHLTDRLPVLYTTIWLLLPPVLRNTSTTALRCAVWEALRRPTSTPDASEGESGQISLSADGGEVMQLSDQLEVCANHSVLWRPRHAGLPPLEVSVYKWNLGVWHQRPSVNKSDMWCLSHFHLGSHQSSARVLGCATDGAVSAISTTFTPNNVTASSREGRYTFCCTNSIFDFRVIDEPQIKKTNNYFPDLDMRLREKRERKL